MKQAKNKFTEVLRPRLNGATRLARRLGISRGYLWAVRNDPSIASEKLLRKLRRLGLVPVDGEQGTGNGKAAE